MSKGSVRRRRVVPRDEYSARWEDTFGEKPYKSPLLGAEYRVKPIFRGSSLKLLQETREDRFGYLDEVQEQDTAHQFLLTVALKELA